MSQSRHTQEELFTQVQYSLIEKLADSERRHRELLESLVEVVFQIDSENKFTFLNRAWNDMLGFEIEDSIGKSILSFVDDPSLKNVVSILEGVTKSRGSIRQEIQFVCKDGSSLWVNFSARPDSQGSISGTLTNITQKKQAIERLSYHVKHDQLTGLLNRSAFKECLNQEIERHKCDPRYKYSLLFLDLDGFKTINDTMGHLSGDKLIISVAERLVNCVQDSDVVARFGGDEFTILLTDISSENQVLSVAQYILDEFQSYFLINNREVFSGVSIGIMLDIDNIFDPHTLLQAADLALYQSKAKGKSCYSIFDRSMFEEAAEKFRLEHEVRLALKEDLVRVHYQPIVSIRRKEIIGIEALARIKRPVQGYLSPKDFIPVAEENNQIIELGNTVIRKALTQTKKWINHFDLKRSFFVAINISGKQLASPDFISSLKRTIDQVGIHPNHIHLELTESMLLSNDLLIEKKLQELRDIGFQIALDDFGTGYSCLSSINHFPLNTLKIDRSFINSITDECDIRERHVAIIKAIVTLAHSLGMDVISEGVENLEQVRILQDLDCDRCQGYLFSPPVPPHQISSFLSDSMPSIFSPRVSLTS